MLTYETLEPRHVLSPIPIIPADLLLMEIADETQEVSFQTDDAQDAKIIQRKPTKNYGSVKKLQLDGVPNKATLIQWDTTPIPTNSTIVSAKISLYVKNTSSNTYGLYKIHQPWQDTGVTWRQFTNNNQGYDDIQLGIFQPNAKGQSQIQLNRAGLTVIQSWINNPEENYGFILRDYSGATDAAKFYSSEAKQLHRRPQLNITYMSSDVPPPKPEPGVRSGAWISYDTLMTLPTDGVAWNNIFNAAQKDISNPNLSDQNDNTDVYTLAKALVGVRLDNQTYIDQVHSTLLKVINTEDGGRTLALGRNLVPYIIAAELTRFDNTQFDNWLKTLPNKILDGKTLVTTHETRPNNWGTMAGASRAAIAVHLEDWDELDRVAKVFKGWLGDRESYAGFKYGDLSWQANPDAPVGINPQGATKDGFLIDGALPDDMRRGGSFKIPPPTTDYPWGALQGAVVQAEILWYAGGYDVWQWEDKALLRSRQFLERIGWEPTGDDMWIDSLFDFHYNTNYSYADTPPGKIMGWTSWTHSL